MAHATHKTPRKLLVIGNGMVGHRYLEELVKRHPDLPAAGLEVTVLGEEPVSYTHLTLPTILLV